ncbi:MAG: hypothetical protein KDE20_24420 [Caldilineaceae bacterium]|nr:hypothetical protein [Caldilineaceae bacterium]
MNETGRARVIVALSIVIAPALVIAWLLVRVVDRTMKAIDRRYGDDFWLVLAVIMLSAVAIVVAGGTLSLVNRWLRHVRARDGLFPLLQTRQGYMNLNEPGAQTLAALGGASQQRISAPTAARVIDAHYGKRQPQPPPAQPAISIPEPAPAPITVRDVVASINPRVSPHWLLVGATGSGKTSASYSILQELARRASCEFMITEPGGVNWGSQAVATRTREIADAIISARDEMERRQDLLRAEDVDHIEDLDAPPPYLILVTEEMDAVLDELKLTDLKRRTETLVALRAIARMGRKPGICLLAVSQSGTTDVFDNHVRKNMGNVLLFRSEHTVNEMWRLQGVKLNELPAGAAYSVQHGSVVSFPLTARPQLSAPQIIDHQPVNRYTAPETASSAGIPVFDTADRAVYTPTQLTYIRNLYARLGSIKAVERELYDQDGGYWFYRLQEAINS